MEFYDEDRPRFVLQSRPSSSRTTEEDDDPKIPNKIFISISVCISVLILSLSFFYFESEPSKSLLLWFSLSILVGTFAPSSLTGGKIRVGHGQILEPEQIHEELSTDSERESRRKSANKRSNKGAKNDSVPESTSSVAEVSKNVDRSGIPNSKENGSVKETEDWGKEDIEILKKQLVKHPAGKPGRWETVASAFGGRYRTENVIKKAKEIGEKKVYESDDYAQFLKNRKASDPRLAEEDTGNGGDEEANKETWSNGEDIALLNALKAFPKEAAMRWEKIAAAVPGKSKAACMKRVTELKKGFRSSKAGGN